jgi:UDP-2,3-diacylglucosamine pyrophosphatase LpxH
MNGDIIDSPYVKMDKSEQRIIDRIKAISYRQKVIWIRGNHDNGYVPESFGKTIFKSSHSIAKRLLITHGDDFDDIMPRSRLFIKAFNLMHNLRIKLGAKPVHVAEYAKNWKSFYRVLCKNIALNAVQCATENGFEAVTCGHSHFPEDVNFNGVRYINTGAWTEFPAYYLHLTPHKMTLNQVDHSFASNPMESIPLNHNVSATHQTHAAHGPGRAVQKIQEISS